MDLTKKRTVEEEIAAYMQERKRCICIHQVIQWAIFVLTIILFFTNWRLGIISTAWFIWNAIAYESGCQSIVIDEYERDGYPELGLKRMFKSWIAFFILAIIALYLLGQIG